MARINFDDSIESQEEFWNLLPLVSGDRDCALGKLVRFFRLAQHHFGRGEAIPAAELASKGLDCMIAAGWAIEIPGGYQAKGAEVHFAWYVQKFDAGKKGGRPRKTEVESENRPVSSVNLPDPTVNLPGPPVNPLALAPSLAPAPSQNNTGSARELRAEIHEAAEVWQDTLRHFKCGRNLMPPEMAAIGRGIQTYGLNPVKFALAGQRHEPRSAEFNPAAHLSLGRIFKNLDTFTRFLNLGVQAEASRPSTAKAVPAAQDEGEYTTDPEKVRALIASALGQVGAP